MNRLPAWFRQEIPDAAVLEKIRLVSRLGVHTVCQEAMCPNLSYCFGNSKLTFLILGDSCTRNCKFCGVSMSKSMPSDMDLTEPLRVREAVRKLGLSYVVITSVTRDDLEDGGAGIFAKTIALIHEDSPDIRVEVLIPDFQNRIESLKCVLDAQPQVIAHNLETIRRLYKTLKALCDYGVSLGILKKIKELNPSIITKSSLILGAGEREVEIIQAMQDLRNADCDILTLGQYLAPSKNHYPVKKFINIEEFQRYREVGLDLGFKAVLSGPKVRSSYQAEEVYQTCMTLS